MGRDLYSAYMANSFLTILPNIDFVTLMVICLFLIAGLHVAVVLLQPREAAVLN